MITSKCLVNILELKKLNQLNDASNKMIFNEPINKLVLNVFIKTSSIKVNISENNEPNGYFINLTNNKLYKNDMNGSNPQLANGNFLFAICDDINYLNNAYKVSNGNLEQLCNYFDGTNLKLIIKDEEINDVGTLILTDDYKIFVRIGSGWFGK